MALHESWKFFVHRFGFGYFVWSVAFEGGGGGGWGNTFVHISFL